MKTKSIPVGRWVLAAALILASWTNALAIGVGDPAPDFELESTNGDKVKLSALRGKTVLLTFYVLDFSAT